MTNGLTTVAGIPGGGGIASKPAPERNEAKKPEPVPEKSWWDYINAQNGEHLPAKSAIPSREQLLKWGLQEAGEAIAKSYRKAQQDACLDWPALNYCASCDTCSGCLKHGACLGGE